MTPPGVSSAALIRAELIRATLRERGIDLLALTALARATGLDERALRGAAAAQPDLGLCGPAGRPLLWHLPPQPLAAGFRADLRDGRLGLLLDGDRPLVLTGHRLGPAPPDGPGEPGSGELSHTVERLSSMATRWLAIPADAGTGDRGPGERTRVLFELIAASWLAGPTPTWRSGALCLHRVRHPGSVATRFWADHAPTAGIELAVHHGRAGPPELVNIYPADPE